MSTATLPPTYIFDMKYSFKVLLLFLCMVLGLSFGVSALAHSGGTDSEGGHYDDDDYHYHHGYPAHDHYDMDGDGDIDCPYASHDNIDHGHENDSSKKLSETGDAISTLKPSNTSREGKPPIVSLIVASAIVLAFIIVPRYLLRNDSDDISIIAQIMSFLCSILPHVLIFLIIYLIKGGFHWAILSTKEIVEAFIFAAGLGFAVATILWLLSFSIVRVFEKLFRTKDIFPFYTDSYAFSFALLFIVRLIQ